MFVDRVIPTAHKRLVTILESAHLIEAAKLLRNADTDIVVVCTSDGLLAGVITNRRRQPDQSMSGSHLHNRSILRHDT